MNILGIMSGTSCDGLDLCNAKIDINKDYNFNYEILNFFTIPFSDVEKKFIFSLRNHDNYTNKENEIELTNIFIKKIKKFCSNLNQIDYIACHGQTVLHIDKKISIQLFDAKYCFEKLDIPIIYNFRNNDIKYGGTGAPLMPFLDWLLFSNKSEDIVTLNIGGIANISHIPESGKRDEVLGFDVGPGMCLVDLASKLLFDSDCDLNGRLSDNGKVIEDLLNDLLSIELIKSSPPKSMDIVDFDKNLLNKILNKFPKINKQDFIRTLVQTTIESIDYNISKYLKLADKSFELIFSGGGTNHPIVKSSFLEKGYNVKMICDYGIDSSIKEALLIAVLGACRINNLTSNMPKVTGASSKCKLGDIYAG
tara:strand:+ start:1444 stop:2538 length:1095 start_codon:yes stop_codon:yes gene_type:complete